MLGTGSLLEEDRQGLLEESRERIFYLNGEDSMMFHLPIRKNQPGNTFKKHPTSQTLPEKKPEAGGLNRLQQERRLYNRRTNTEGKFFLYRKITGNFAVKRCFKEKKRSLIFFWLGEMFCVILQLFSNETEKEKLLQEVGREETHSLELT